MNFWWKWKYRLAGALRLDLTHTQVQYARFLASHVTPGVRWLEVGCGRHIVPEWAIKMPEQRTWAERASLLAGIDVDSAIAEHPLLNMRVYGLAGTLPFRPASFDLISANMVAEHFPNPEEILRDVHSTLSPGGRFIFHTPNYRYYLIRLASWTPDTLKGWIVGLLERRREEDRFQTFYLLNTRDQITRLAAQTGFEVETLRVQSSNGSFGEVGPAGWLECFILKLLTKLNGGEWNSNLVVCLRKPAHTEKSVP